MANDGRVSGSQQHTEYQPLEAGGVSGSQQHTEYQPLAAGGVSGSQQHIEFLPVQVGVVTSVLLMVEYSDVLPSAFPTLVQGEFLFQRTGLQGSALVRTPWQVT